MCDLIHCRALEASAEENAARMKRKRCEAQSEMCSPADWIRQDDWPVGIRNVGNTCWFSAVIQVRMRTLIGYIKVKRICAGEELNCSIQSWETFLDTAAVC